jgi:hypothetical protein
MTISPENLAMAGSDCPAPAGTAAGCFAWGTDHPAGRREVPLGMPSVRVPAKLCDLSPLAGPA